jgi:hypothetical protein
MAHFLKINTEEFIHAMKGLYRKGLTSRKRPAPVDIGLDRGSVVFSTERGLVRTWLLEGSWPGYATVSLNFLLTFLQIKPKGETVELKHSDGRLIIGTSSIPSVWVDASEFLVSISTEIRFEGEDPEHAVIRNCPSLDVCPKVWSEMIEGKKENLRSCPRCLKEVRLCKRLKDFQEALRRNMPIAIPMDEDG